MNWSGNRNDEKGHCMINPLNYLLIAVTTFCFGLLVSFQISHIYYTRKLARLAKRSVNTGTIAPVLVELEEVMETD